MARVSGLKTNRTNSPNISSLKLKAGDLVIFHQNSWLLRKEQSIVLKVTKSPNSVVIVAQSISVAVTLFPQSFVPSQESIIDISSELLAPALQYSWTWYLY